MNFEWKTGKAEKNRDKHGISFEEALTVSRDEAEKGTDLFTEQNYPFLHKSSAILSYFSQKHRANDK